MFVNGDGVIQWQQPLQVPKFGFLELADAGDSMLVAVLDPSLHHWILGANGTHSLAAHDFGAGSGIESIAIYGNVATFAIRAPAYNSVSLVQADIWGNANCEESGTCSFESLKDCPSSCFVGCDAQQGCHVNPVPPGWDTTGCSLPRGLSSTPPQIYAYHGGADIWDLHQSRADGSVKHGQAGDLDRRAVVASADFSMQTRQMLPSPAELHPQRPQRRRVRARAKTSRSIATPQSTPQSGRIV